jgi:hypothetical protein
MIGTEVVQDHATEMPGEGLVVEGWDGIAKAMNRGKTTVRRWARRSSDPLPVMKLGGTVYCQVVELEKWVQRNRKVL